jgi:hypothetical protein
MVDLRLEKNDPDVSSKAPGEARKQPAPGM